MVTAFLGIFTSDILVKEKLFFALVYLVIPVVPYLVLRKLRFIDDIDITKRKQRPLFFTIVYILYGIAYWIVLKKYGVCEFSNVALCLFVAQFVLSVVNYFWKMSGHMTFAVVMFSTICYLFRNKLLLLLFLFVPLLAWSRVILRKHTVAQVVLGTITSLIECILIYGSFC